MKKLTPRKAIREFCKECTSGNLSLCGSPKCKLYHYKRSKTIGNPELSSLRAIKAHCLECTGYQYEETKNCTDLKCWLYPFRLGRFPQRFKVPPKGMSAEHMKKIRPS